LGGFFFALRLWRARPRAGASVYALQKSTAPTRSTGLGLAARAGVKPVLADGESTGGVAEQRIDDAIKVGEVLRMESKMIAAHIEPILIVTGAPSRRLRSSSS